MNNIRQFPLTVEYPAVSAATLRQAADAARAASTEVKRCYLQTNYLPSLHTRVNTMDRAVQNAAFTLRESVHSLDHKLSINIRTLRGYQTELQTAPASDTQEILEDISAQTVKIVEIVSTQNTGLKYVLTAIRETVDRNTTAGYLSQLESEQQQISLQLLAFQAQKDALDLKRITLSDAMALLEAKGIAEIGKETMLNAQEMAKMGMAPPEMAVVDAAIKLAQEALEKLESLLNYVGLIEARDTLRAQIVNLMDSIQHKNRELRAAETKHQLIVGAHDFDDSRQQFVNEFEKVVVAHQSFLDVYRAVDAQDQQTISQFAVDANSLATHLKSAI